MLHMSGLHHWLQNSQMRSLILWPMSVRMAHKEEGSSIIYILTYLWLDLSCLQTRHQEIQTPVFSDDRQHRHDDCAEQETEWPRWRVQQVEWEIRDLQTMAEETLSSWYESRSENWCLRHRICLVHWQCGTQNHISNSSSFILYPLWSKCHALFVDRVCRDGTGDMMSTFTPIPKDLLH